MPFPRQNIGLTFRRLVELTAEYRGMGIYGDEDEEAGLPADPEDLRIAVNIVEQAWSAFLMADGEHRWRFLSRIAYIQLNADGEGPDNVDGSASLYRMPWDFTGQYSGEFYFEPDSDMGLVRIIQPEQLGRMQQVESSGIPRYAAFRPLRRGQHSSRFAVEFYPTPGSNDGLYLNIAGQPMAWELEDRHIAGAAHDQTLIQACKAMAELDQTDRPGTQYALYESMLARSIKFDKRTGPRNIGLLIDPANLTDGYLSDAYFGHPAQSVTVYGNVIP